MPLGNGMPSFPGDPPFTLSPARRIARGDPYNLSEITLGTHAGTHVDPPSHFVEGGLPIDRVDLDRLNGPCVVVEVPAGVDEIPPSAVDGLADGVSRVLFRTSNSERWRQRLAFFPDYVALSPASAAALLERGVRTVGLDALSIERDVTGTFPVHRLLLGAGVAIIEGLLLAEAAGGAAVLRCLPLRLRDGDGGPARATLEYP